MKNCQWHKLWTESLFVCRLSSVVIPFQCLNKSDMSFDVATFDFIFVCQYGWYLIHIALNHIFLRVSKKYKELALLWIRCSYKFTKRLTCLAEDRQPELRWLWLEKSEARLVFFVALLQYYLILWGHEICQLRSFCLTCRRGQPFKPCTYIYFYFLKSKRISQREWQISFVVSQRLILLLNNLLMLTASVSARNAILEFASVFISSHWTSSRIFVRALMI